MRVASLLSAFLAALLATLTAGAAPAVAAKNTTIFQLTASNFKTHTNGSRTVLCAFVNPFLPASLALHPILHQLTAQYANRPDVLIAFADVHRNRGFLKQFGLTEVPTLKVFGHNLPSKLPIGIEFSLNKTAVDYSRELDVIVHTLDGWPSDSATFLGSARQLVAAVHEREQSRIKEAAAKKAAAAEKGEEEKETEPVTTVIVDEEEASAVAAVSAEGVVANATEAAAPANTTAAPVDPLDAAVASSLAEVQAAIEHQVKLVEAIAAITVKRLQSANATLAELAEAKTGGISLLARHLNQKLRGITIGTDFIKPQLREQTLVDLTVLRSLLEPYFEAPLTA